MLYVAIDIETTGLDPNIHDIIEFGAVIDNLANPLPLNKLPIYHALFAKENYTINPYCISLHKRIWDSLNKNEGNIIEISDLMYGFSNFLVKNKVPYDKNMQSYSITVAGKNFANFDLPFLKNKIPLNKWGEVHFKHRFIDPAILYLDPNIDIEVPNMQLCLERAGIQEKVAHGAVSDALQVVKLVRKHFLK
jgi:DNA polymerase III alpha subunit (gram-positive type)